MHEVTEHSNLFLDDIQSASIKHKIPDSITFVTMSYLGKDLEEQSAIGKLLGIPSLEESSKFSLSKKGHAVPWDSIENGTVKKTLIDLLIKILSTAKKIEPLQKLTSSIKSMYKLWIIRKLVAILQQPVKNLRYPHCSWNMRMKSPAIYKAISLCKIKCKQRLHSFYVI